MKVQNAEFASEAARDTVGDQWVDVVRKQVGSLKFGVVQIIVHENRVVQIERTEKVRLSPHIAGSAHLT